MSGSGKQSFYEIQLSNSSLIVAFLMAVGIGLAVFTLGVMVGKGQAPTMPADQEFVDNLASDSAQAETPASSDLDFFERVQDPIEGEEGTEGAMQPAAVDAPEANQPATELSTAPTESSSAPTESSLPAADMNIASGYVVQVKSTPDRDEADGLQAALAGAGFPAFVVSGDVGGRTFYRVRVGRYRDRSDAERIAAALNRRSEIEESWVTEG